MPPITPLGAGSNPYAGIPQANTLSQATERFGQVLGNTLGAATGAATGGAGGQGAAGLLGGLTPGNMLAAANNLLTPGGLTNAVEQGIGAVANAANVAGGGAGATSATTRRGPEFGRFNQSSTAVSSLVDSLHTAVGNRIAITEGARAEADEAAKTLLSGGDIDLHNVIMAAEKAGIELKLTMTLRNKLLEAYQEIMRTPV